MGIKGESTEQLKSESHNVHSQHPSPKDDDGDRHGLKRPFSRRDSTSSDPYEVLSRLRMFYSPTDVSLDLGDLSSEEGLNVDSTTSDPNSGGHVPAAGVPVLGANVPVNPGITDLTGNNEDAGRQRSGAKRQQLSDRRQRLLHSAITRFNDIERCLSTSSHVQRPHSTLYRLRNRLHQLLAFNLTSAKVLGVIGDSGQGKSTTINSLLGVTGLAKTDESGSAVTAFVTEFRYRQPDPDFPFYIECEYLSIEEIHSLLKDLLLDLQAPIHSEGHARTEEAEDAERKYNIARDTLITVFGNTEKFPDFNLRDFEASLQDTEAGPVDKSVTFEDLLIRLQSWADELQFPFGTKEGMWISLATSVPDVHNKMKPFIKQGLWPLVKVMRIFVTAKMLENGLVIADLPGFRDVNNARVLPARRYQSRCDAIFVVVNIARSIDDTTVREAIHGMTQTDDSVGPIIQPDLAVVCTHAANIPDSKINGHFRNKKYRPEWEAAMKGVEAAESREDLSYHAQRKLCQEAESKLKYVFVRMRNEKICTKLKRRHADKFSNGSLPVFCVDNIDYQAQKFPHAVEQSGIPKLLHKCQVMQSVDLIERANNFLNILIPRFLTSLENWLRMAQSQEIRDVAEAIKPENLRPVLMNTIDQFKRFVASEVGTQIQKPYQSEATNFQAAAASKVSNDWIGRRFYSTIAATIRCFGRWKTADWDNDLVQISNSSASLSWGQLDGRLVGHLDDWISPCIDALYELVGEAYRIKAPDELRDCLKKGQKQCQSVFNREANHFLKEFRTIKTRAVGSASGSYISEDMHVVYTQCQNDRGPGVLSRNELRLSNHLQRPEMYLSIGDRIEKEMTELADSTAASLTENTGSIVDKLQTDIDMVGLPADAIEEQDAAFMTNLEILLPKVKADLKKIAAGLVAELGTNHLVGV